MLIAKERKDLKVSNQKGKRAGGCWYRNKAVWPKATLYNVEMSDNAHRYENSMDERFLPLATPLANYYGEFSSRVQALAVALFNDIYHNPASTVEMVLRNQDCAREYGSDLFSIMTLVGGFNVVFDDGNIKGEVIEASEEIASGLYLTSKRIGMPVRHFLLYYKGGDLRREDIAKLSGIPTRYVQWVYNILTAYMWEMLDGIHRHKAQELKARRKYPVRQPAEDIQLLVDFSRPRQTAKAEESTTEEPVADSNPMDMSIDELQALMDKVLGEIEDASGLEPKTSPVVFDQVPFDPNELVPADFTADDFSE